MKGQFFVIGALFICILLFFGMPINVSITKAETDDMSRISDNLAAELPHALNLGINGSGPVETLMNFTEFSIDAAGSHGINMTCFWLVFTDNGTTINVSGGNFMGSPKTFSINISGATKDLYVGGGSTNWTTFSPSGYAFNVSVTVDGDVSGGTMLRNKTSIYSRLSLERGRNLVRKEILA